jgi:hypothetical protein
MSPVDSMGRSLSDASKDLCQLLDAICAALGRPPSSWEAYGDEHVRYEIYQVAAAAVEAGHLDLGGLTDRLRIDPDRLMASSAAGLLLVPKRPLAERELVRSSMSDCQWVGARFGELAIFDRLVRSDANDPSDLRGAGGWLEEQLAERSESVAVLEYLAVSAIRRRARHDARERLRRLTA